MIVKKISRLCFSSNFLFPWLRKESLPFLSTPIFLKSSQENLIWKDNLPEILKTDPECSIKQRMHK